MEEGHVGIVLCTGWLGLKAVACALGVQQSAAIKNKQTKTQHS